MKYLFVSRLRKNKKPLVLKLTLPNDEDEKDEMEEEFGVCIISCRFTHHRSRRSRILGKGLP